MMKGTGMLKMMIRFIDSDSVVIIRLACGLCLILIAVSLAFGQGMGESYFSLRETEHRFSVLETKVDGIHADIDDLKSKSSIMLLMAAAILGDRGVQIARNKLKKAGGD